MDDWLLVLAPLVALPIVALLGFVGCGVDAVGAEKAPTYRDYIMGVTNSNDAKQKHPLFRPDRANIIGYWRLGDADGVAADEKDNARPGKYFVGQSLPNENPAGASPGSEAAPGQIVTGKENLTQDKTTSTSRFFNGGFMQVPWDDKLYTGDFTIETWFDFGSSPPAPNFQHTVFSAGGYFRARFDETPAFHGFSLFGVGDRWDVRVLPKVGPVFSPPLPMIPAGPGHVALTVQRLGGVGAQVAVRLYVLGKEAATAIIDDYSLPDGAALFVGVLNNTPDNDGSPQPRTPVLAKLQEVVLHNVALEANEIENHATFKVS
jgi:hypothetical protein